MGKLFLVVLLVAMTTGCAMGFGVAKQAPDVDDQCWGLFMTFGQSDACGIEGEAISLPGVQTVGHVVCAITSAGLVWMGRPPLSCGGDQPPES